MTFKATLRASQKEHGENEFFHSGPGGTSGMHQCVLCCDPCQRLRAFLTGVRMQSETHLH